MSLQYPLIAANLSILLLILALHHFSALKNHPIVQSNGLLHISWVFPLVKYVFCESYNKDFSIGRSFFNQLVFRAKAYAEKTLVAKRLAWCAESLLC